MPNWKKLIVSGSDAHLNSLDIATFVSASEFVGGNFQGDGSNLTFQGTGIVSSSAQTDRSWVVGANGFSDYTFSGSGLTGTENDPTLYLTRGEVYRFEIQSGGSHPFRIQSTPNGSAGTPYNDGLSGNDLTSGTLVWNVQFDSPSVLYYQCVNHGSMGGVIHILDKLPEGIISSSAQIGAEISGSITEFSSSLVARVVDLEITGSDHEVRLDTAEGSISSLNAATSSYALINDISGAFDSVSSSFEQRITSNEGSISSLNSATSSYLLNTTDTLDGDLTVTGKITAQEFHTEFVSASILYDSGSTKFGDTSDDVHSFTGSVNISGSIYADNLIGIISSSAQIASDISGSFTSLSSSLEQRIALNEATGSDQEIRLDTAEGSISSLNAATSSYALQADISGAFDNVSSSFEQRITLNEATGSDHEIRLDVVEGSISSLNDATSSYALEANISGAFTSVSQSIAADIEDIIDGTTTVASSSYALTASYALNAESGAGFPFSGSAIITGSLYVSQSTISGSFVGDGSGIEGVVSSSYALTASYALNAGGADTGSLLATASVAGSTITFEKGDGSTFDVTVSANATSADALVTASLTDTTLTFQKGDTSTFDIILPGGGYSGSNATAHLNQTVAATTWSFGHNLDDRYPVFTVFDNNGDIIVPNRVETVDNNNANIYFTTARTGTATAVIASSISQISSITSNFTNQTTVAVTHSLDTRNIHVSVYDENYALIIPESIVLDTLDTVVVTFPVVKSGTVVVAKGGHVISGSAATAISSSYILSSGVDGPLGMNSILSASYSLTSSYNENATISGSFTINDFVWPTTDGTYGVEVLTTDGAGGLTFEIPTNVYETVKNVSGGPLVKGTPVHATGSATLGNAVGVIAADALDPTKMPATYILHQNLADEEEGLGIAVGFITGVDTRGLVEGEPVYVGAGGGWTQTKPTGSALIQNLGIVTKVAENGSGVVLGAGRSNDVPNITQGYAWVGNADQVATATPTASFFVTSGSHALNADDAISASYAVTSSYSNYAVTSSFSEYALDTAHAAAADEAINSDTLDYLDSTQFVRSDQSGTLTGDLTVTGTLTAQEFHTEFVSASILYDSGSTKFGDSADDIHSFTGSIQVLGDITGSINPTGHLLPSTTNLYDLGSPTQQWRDLYLSSASLYVDGVKIISSDANVLTFTTDLGQSIKILEAGSDDITLQTENGNIELKGTVEITSGKKIIDSAGTVIQFGDSLGVTGSITTSGTVNGVNLQAFSSSLETRVSDLELFSSSLNVESSSYALSSSYAVSASYTVSSSHSVTASYIDPTFISSSAAASGFGQGGVTEIIAGSGISINQGTGAVTVTALAASGSQGQNVIAPFAFAFVDTTSNGTGTGISWGNWNGSNYTLDFTFATAQSDANYSVITDSETFDDYFVGISNKTTTGFRAEFYDNTQSRTPSTFSPFTFFVYGSDPIATVGVAVTGSLVSTGSLSSNTLTFTKGDGTTFGIDLTGIQPTSASHAVTASYIDPTFISASAAASGFGAGGGGGTGDGFPYVGDAVITGSLFVSGGLISGSFKGDGSQLTGIDVGAVASISDTFTSQTQVVVTHNFNSKDVNVAVYNSSDEYIIPDNITLSTVNTVTVDFAVPTSGRIVVSKGGHILSGIGLNTKAGSVATSSFAATGSSFYYDVVFDAPFASANYTVGLQAHSQFSVPDSFPGHAWVDSDKATTGFRIVVPSFDSSMDEISWTAVAHGESNVTASSALTASYVDYSNVANKPTLISSSLQFNTLTTPFTGSFTGSFYGDGSNLSGVTSYTDADTLSFIQGYSGSYSGSFVGDGSQLSGVTSYTDADTLAYINSLAVVSGSSITGSFTGSFYGDGTGLTGLGYGDTKKLNQAVAATTWSFNHNMNEQYPTVTVYNELNEVVQPTKIEAVSTSTLNLYFGIPTAGTAVAVVGGVALTQEAGFNRTLSQTVAATTWSFAHNLGQKYPQFEVYDSNDDLIIPGRVQAVDQNNAILYFDTPQAGTVAATVGGTAMTASYSDTLTVVDTLLSTQENTDVDTGTETVATVSTSLYDGAFFDYVIKDGTNYRAGTVMAVWDGTSVQYNDNSTADIGDTSGVVLAVDISGTDARLRATVSSDNWNIKAFVRAL